MSPPGRLRVRRERDRVWWVRLRCRLFHMGDWIYPHAFGERFGDRIALRCPRKGCGCVWYFHVSIPARGHVGKTPR